MRWLERFRMAMLMLFRREVETERLGDELQFHVDQQVKENIARGLLGLLIGVAGGATAGILIRSILYGTKALDPVVFAVMVGSLLFTALVACALPAIRASRIEPMQALRIE
jgi:ABC-type antimicrobial peptide transport system permease subunit